MTKIEVMNTGLLERGIGGEGLVKVIEIQDNKPVTGLEDARLFNSEVLYREIARANGLGTYIGLFGNSKGEIPAERLRTEKPTYEKTNNN